MVPRIACLLVGSIAFCGCSRGEWTIAVENRGAVPCTVAVDLGPTGGTADVVDVEPGHVVTLIGGKRDAHLKSIRVNRKNQNELTFSPNMPVPVGTRCLIVIDADGKAEPTITDP